MNTANNDYSIFNQFCKDIFGSDDVSLRCVAESKELKEFLAGQNGSESKLQVLKLGPSQGPMASRLKSASDFNKKGYAVYYLPTKFKDGYDESYGAAESFRALVVDLDGTPLPDFSNTDSKPLPNPTCQIETSPGKYQLIFKLSPPAACIKVRGLGEGITVDDFNELATQLAVIFNGDLNVCKATQPFRAPGFQHRKREPGFTSSIIQNSGTTYSYDVLRSLCSKAIKGRKRVAGVSGTTDSSFRDAVAIDLTALRAGKVALVPRGLRHDTDLRLRTLLMHEGLTDEEVRREAARVISASFEEGEEFLRERSQEIEHNTASAHSYVQESKEEQKALISAVLASVDKPETFDNSGKPFKYNFDSRLLQTNKYNESAVVERVLQRFSSDLARIDGRTYCFNNGERLWNPQTSDLYPEVKARASSCITDTISEEGFVKELCCDAKGNLSLSKRQTAIASLYRVNTVNSISKGVINSLAVTKYNYSDFDSREELLYCANGVLNLRTNELRDARNEDRLLNRTAVAWDTNAACPGWLKFISDVFANNDEPKEMTRFIQEVFGYSLSGEIGEEKLFIHQGDGCNGKSKLTSALRLISGKYCTMVEPEELVTKHGSFQKSFERTGAKVEGKRCVIIDDFDVESAWNESFVKVLTGSFIRARGEYEKSRLVPNRSKFHICLNIAPKPEAENLGILRRLCFIPYLRTFTQSGEYSRALDAMMRDEASGILAWAVEGFKRGINYPSETKAALEEYRKENFSLETALTELYDLAPEEGAGSWELMYDIVSDITSHLKAIGKESFRINSEIVGQALKRAGATRVKKWDKEAHNAVRQYYLALKFKRNHNLAGLSAL